MSKALIDRALEVWQIGLSTSPAFGAGTTANFNPLLAVIGKK
jgi:hypothetical protein